MGGRQKQSDLSEDILVNGVSEIADSLAGSSAETPSVAEMMANPASAIAAASVRAAQCIADDPNSQCPRDRVSGQDSVTDAEPGSLDAEDPESAKDNRKKKKQKKGLGPRWSYIITRGIVIA